MRSGFARHEVADQSWDDESDLSVRIFNTTFLLTNLLLLLVLIPTRIQHFGFLGPSPYRRSSETSPLVENADRIGVLGALCIGLVMGALGITKLAVPLVRKAPPWISLASFLFICGGLVSVNEYSEIGLDSRWSHRFFGGFGLPGLATVLCALLLLVLAGYSMKIRTSQDPAKGVRLTASLLSLAVLSVIYLPASVILSRAVPFRTDWGIGLFEILGPLAGRPPLLETIPQYSSLMGWPLVLTKPFSASLQLDIAVIYISVLFVLLVLVIAALLHLVLPRANFLIVLLFVFGLVLYRPSNSIVGSMTTFPSFTLRHLLPTIGLYVLILGLTKNSRRMYCLAGLILGCSYLNNFEFGLVALICAITISVLSSWRRNGAWKMIILTPVMALLTIGTFFALAGLEALNRHTLIARTFGSGFGNLPMPIFGLQSLTLSGSAAALALGFWQVIARQQAKITPHSLVSVAFGLYSLLGHTYYANRSVVSTQLQTLLPFVAISVTAALAPIATYAIRKLILADSWRSSTHFLPIVALVVCPLVVLTGLPDPNLELARIRGQIADEEVPGNIRIDSEVFRNDSLYRHLVSSIENGETDPDDVGVISSQFEVVYQLLTGAEGLTPLADHSLNSLPVAALLCSRIRDFSGNTVIVGSFGPNSRDLGAEDRVRNCLRTLGRSWQETSGGPESPTKFLLNG
jgi:hypothetical protein